MQEETPREKRKRIECRNRYRNTVCVGCRHSYYNFAKPQSERGDVAVAEDYSCWWVTEIRRGKCSMHSK